MTPLVVEVDGRVLRLEGDRTFRIGRSIDADIVMTAGSASRQHAEIRPVDGGWVIVDAGSQFGTFVDGRQVSEHPITDRVVVSCGPDAPGSVLTIYPAAIAPAELAEPSHAPAPPPVQVDSDMPTAVDQPRWPHAVPDEEPEAPQPGSFDYPPPSGPPVGGAEAAPPPAPPGAQFAPPGEFAPPGDGAPAQPAPPPYSPGPGAPGGFPMEQTTQGIALPPPGPHGMPGMPDPHGAPMMQQTGPDLLIVAEGREHRFRHPTPITVGRNPDNTVVMNDPAVSRQHGQINPVAGGWTYHNVSGEGTFLDGRRITSKNFDERVNLRLGHPVAGPELSLVPILSAVEEEKRFARKRRNKTLLIIGAAAAALVLVLGIGGIAFWAGGRGDDVVTADPSEDTSQSEDGDTLSELTDDELNNAKAATVRILAESELEATGQEVQYSGSGSIIREDGLILTNAHVATPGDDEVNEKYGIPDEQVVATPDYLIIAITDPDTGESEPTYRAEVVASDGELDAAVLHIVGDVDGNELDQDPELPTVPVGESGDVELNDPVTVLGFPGVTSSDPDASETEKPITITDGKISTILADVDEFDTTARISGGNSGGMAINNDAELIGVPSYGRFDGRGGQSNRLKMVDALKDVIEEAESAVD